MPPLPEALKALVDESQGATDLIRAAMAQPVLDAGMQLWQGLALIVVVWTGLQMALGGGGLNMATVARMVLGLSIPLGMLRFYTAPLPGTGQTAPDLITGMGGWLKDLIVNDSSEQMMTQIRAMFAALGTRLGEGFFGGGEDLGWMRVLTNLPGMVDAAFGLVVTLVLMLSLIIGLIVVWAIGQAQVMWGQIALAISLLLGPVFIPWIVVPQLSFLFWSWLRTLLVYSLYGAVAAVIFRIISELGVRVVEQWAVSVDDALFGSGAGLGRAGLLTALTVPYIIAAGFAAAKVGELTQLLVLGSGNMGSGAGRASGQALRAVRMVRGGI